MTRLEKEALGKQVVSMRQTVKRAKLWLVHNLVRQAKRLKEKKGNDTQKAKYARRAERCVQEINVIKQISEDEVSKFALCNKKSPGDAMKQAEALPVDQRALIRLATCKPVQERVAAFREEYPDAIERTILLTKALGLKYQKKREKLKQIQTTKPTTASESPSENLPEQNEIANDTEEPSDALLEPEQPEISEDLGKEVKPSKMKPVTAKSTAQTKKPNKNNAKENSQISAEDVEPVTQSAEAPKSNPAEKPPRKNRVTVAWPSLPVPIAGKRQGTVEIRRLNLSEWHDDGQPPIKPDEDDKPEKEIGYTPSSSFFLGGKSDSEPEDDEDGEEQNHSFKRKFSDRKANNRNGSFSRDNSEWSKKPQKKTKVGPQKSHNMKKVDEREAPPPVSIENEKLHPSWAAKRAHKPLVTEFQGKKITFDD